MPNSDDEWIRNGKGATPSVAWSFAADGGIAGFAQSRETGESLLADNAGGVYLLDRNGKVAAMGRGFRGASHVAWSDGGTGAALVEDAGLCLFDRKLKPAWEIDLVEPVLAIAITPFGNHVAASLRDGTTVIHDRTAKRITRFTTSRPLHHLAFVVGEPHLVGASDYGLVGRWRLDGQPLWEENVLSNTGDLAVTGDGRRIALASFNRGVQLFRGKGRSAGLLAVEGTPERVALSYEPDVIAATTVEGDVYWMDLDGDVRWAATLPAAVARIVAAPLGDGLAIAFDPGRVVQLRWSK